MRQRIFNMQSSIKEVTITIDIDEYINIMAILKSISDGVNSDTATKWAKDIKNIIEEIEPQYIWDD